MDLIDLPSPHKKIIHGRFDELDHLIQKYNESRDYGDNYDDIIVLLFLSKFNKLSILAIEVIDRALEEMELSEFEEATLLAFKIEFLLMMGNNQHAFSIFDTLSDKIQNKEFPLHSLVGDLHVYTRLLKAKYYQNISDVDLAYNYVNEAKHLLKEEFSVLNLLTINQICSYVYQEQGKFDKAISKVDDLLDQVSGVSSFLEFQAYKLKTEIMHTKGELENARKLIEKAEEILGDNIPSAIEWELNNLKGKTSLYLGDLEKTKSYDLRNLELARKINSTIFLSVSYNNLGTLAKSIGDMDAGLEYLFLALDMNEELGNTTQIGIIYNNIAINYMMKGELDRALEFLNRSLTIAEEYGKDTSLAVCYVNLGQVFHMKGEYEEAEKYYKLCQVIDEKYENGYNLSEVIYNLLTLHIEKNEIDKAKTYLTKLEDIDQEFDNKVINLRYRLGKVQILKSGKRSINKAKAQEQLIEIVEEEPVDFELYVSALLNLCDLLLLELKQTGEDEVLEEIKMYVERLHEYATQQQAYNTLAESYLIKSKIAQLELDMAAARRYIDMAESVSLDKGMDKLAIKISAYYDSLLDKMKSMEVLYDKNSSLKERLEEVQLEELFLKMLTTKADEMKTEHENPTMFLINQEGGNNLYKRIFDETTSVNEELIAGLFSALHALSDEVFNTSSSTQRIKHEDYTIIMKAVRDEFLFCYVFRGQSFNALKKLNRIVEAVSTSKTIWNALNREISHLTKMEKEGMDMIVDSIISQEIHQSIN